MIIMMIAPPLIQARASTRRKLEYLNGALPKAAPTARQREKRPRAVVARTRSSHWSSGHRQAVYRPDAAPSRR